MNEAGNPLENIFSTDGTGDPSSKDGIEKWIARDYASTLYEKRGSQDFWNLMDRITDAHMDAIMKDVQFSSVLSILYRKFH